jgi:hypothetical protein
MAGKMASYVDSEAFLQKPGNCSLLLYPTANSVLGYR